MPNYRRAFVPGGCWFFTVNLLDGKQRLLVSTSPRSARPLQRRAGTIRSRLMRLSFFRTTFMQSGRFWAAMQIFPCGGD
jgi:hypothetical protein